MIVNKTLVKSVNRILGIKGFKGYSSKLMINTLTKDIKDKEVPIATKIWAWKRGFSSTRVHSFNINEANYRDHMPDFDYYKLHPINEIYSRWIDDKLTTKYVLAPFNEFMPKYYFQIKNKEILKLMDCPDDIEVNVNGIINLLKIENSLALKLLSGSLGAGFYKLTYENNTFYVNSNEKSLNELKIFIEGLEGYLVTEYIISHKHIRKIYDVTPNTLRVQIIKDKNKKPIITGSFIRFGTQKTGVLETITVGAIFAGVDIESGAIFNPKLVEKSNLVSVKLHPDTNEEIEIVLPHWEKIKQKVYEISEYVPGLTYLGFDIIITDDSFKIIEINSLSGLTVLSYYFPFFEKEYCKDFFLNNFNENPEIFKRVLNMLNS